MEKILILVCAFFSANLMAADIYEFKPQEPTVKPVPVPPSTHASSVTRQSHAAPASTTARDESIKPAHPDEIAHVHHCTNSETCNDL